MMTMTHRGRHPGPWHPRSPEHPPPTPRRLRIPVRSACSWTVCSAATPPARPASRGRSAAIDAIASIDRPIGPVRPARISIRSRQSRGAWPAAQAEAIGARALMRANAW